MPVTKLAEKAGLTRATINKFEDDVVRPHEGTISDIVRVFDDEGIEFIGDTGVQIKPQGVQVLVGPQGLCDFFDDVYEHARKHGGKIMQLGIDEDLFWVMGDHSPVHRARMAALVTERKDIKVQAILCEGDTNFIASDYNEYRWISKDIFSPVPFYIYGQTLAIMAFQTTPGPTIIVHKFPSVTAAYRKQFEAFWKLSKRVELQQVKPQRQKAK
jgi:DNA-binding XRE family transcriptional regulator